MGYLVYIKGSSGEVYIGSGEGLSIIYSIPGDRSSIAPFGSLERAKEYVNNYIVDYKKIIGEIRKIQYLELCIKEEE